MREVQVLREHEYCRDMQELNIRPIKKIIDAKAKKKRQRRAARCLERSYMKEEAFMTSTETGRTNTGDREEATPQIKKLFKKVRESHKEVTNVIAKKECGN